MRKHRRKQGVVASFAKDDELTVDLTGTIILQKYIFLGWTCKSQKK